MQLLRQISLTLIVSGTIAFSGSGQVPTQKKELTSEQKQLQVEAQKWNEETARLRDSGKLEDAIATAKKMLSAELKLYGELHDDPIASLDQIAELQEQLNQLNEATGTRQELLELQTRRFGKDHWRVTSARVEFESVAILGKLSAAARKEIAEDELMDAEREKGNHSQAVTIGERVMAKQNKLLGESHPRYLRLLEGLANSYERMGETLKAERLLAQVEVTSKKVYGENHPRYVDSLFNLASGYRTVGDNSKVGMRLSQAEAILKKVFSDTDLDYAAYLDRLALLYHSIAEHEKAEALYYRAIEITKNLLGANHPDYASRLNKLAEVFEATGGFAEAESLYIQAKEINKAVFGESSPEYATSLSHLGFLALATADYLKADPLLLQAREITRQVNGENHPSYPLRLNGLAQLYEEMGQFSKAESLYLQAKEIHKRVRGEQHPDYAVSLNNLGFLYQSMADYARAELLLLQSISIAQKALGENSLDYASSLNSLATLYVAMGEYARAEPLYLRAKEITKRALGENHTYAVYLYNLSILYQSMGEYAKAEPLSVQARDIFKKELGENHPKYAITLSELAGIYQEIGAHQKAEPLYLQAREITKKMLGENHPEYAKILGNLGWFYFTRGNSAKAEPLLLQAKEIRRKLLGENHPDYARSLHDLAALYKSKAEAGKTELLLLQAKEIRRKLLGEHHPDYARSLHDLAMLYQSIGEPSKAEPLFLQAVGIITTNLERTAEIQTETSQLISSKKNRFYLENLLAGTAHQSSTSVYEPLFRIHGAITARQMFLRALRQSKPEVKPLIEELQKTSHEMSRLIQTPPNPKLNIDVPKKLEELTAQYERLQRELAAKSDAYAQFQKRQKATPADLQKLLPNDSMLIEFLGYRDQFCAFVVSKTSIHRIELGAIEPIAQAVERFREQLNRFEPLTGKEDDPALFLREKLWKPLVKPIGSAKLLLVCPDGPLYRLPFVALPNADGTKYLIEEVAMCVMPVPQMMFDLLAPKPARTVAPSLFTLGDVDFDELAPALVKVPEPNPSARRRAGGPMNWSPLPGTQDEVVAITDSFKTAIPDGKTISLRGKEATQRALREQMGRFEYVHLATHGYFSPRELTAKLKPNEAVELRDSKGERPRPSGLHSGLMSGIVCAGANQPSEENDGVLTALEISELDLSKVELAILSACDTGLGETAGGEGVFGLQRAFQLAGVRTTVTSRWKISDVATQKLMTRYYENFFKKKMGSLESLREAQLWMLKEGTTRGLVRVDTAEDQQPRRSPPLYWAAFSLAGDWR